VILHPGVLALLASSFLTCLLVLGSVPSVATIVRRWDRASGSEQQLALERRTYLISTLWSYVLAFQAISFFLFVYTADNLHSLFYGAMCAAGTLNVNRYGYPLFLLKAANVLMAGVWLVLNHADNRGFDYPLVRGKYVLLLGLTPFVLGEAALQALYFLNLKAEVITSCCGALFSTESRRLVSELAAAPVGPTRFSFFAILALIVASGLAFLWKGRGALLYSGLAAAAFGVFAVSLVSFLCLYFYEMPSHHCPFCILQREYRYVGYPLYGTLFTGAVSGLGVGVLHPFRRIRSLSGVVPALQRRLIWISLAAYLAFAAISIQAMIVADFRLGGP
jgi:hypothetical protein